MKRDIFSNPRVVNIIYGFEYDPFFDIEKFGVKHEENFNNYFSKGLQLIGVQNSENITAPRVVFAHSNNTRCEMSPVGTVLRFQFAQNSCKDALKLLSDYVMHVFSHFYNSDLFKFNNISAQVSVHFPLIDIECDLNKIFLDDFFSSKVPSCCVGSSLSYALNVDGFKLDIVANQYEARESEVTIGIDDKVKLSKFIDGKQFFFKMDMENMKLKEKGLGYVVKMNAKKAKDKPIDADFIASSINLLEDATSGRMDTFLF